jgi:hypothetical protein
MIASFTARLYPSTLNRRECNEIRINRLVRSRPVWRVCWNGCRCDRRRFSHIGVEGTLGLFIEGWRAGYGTTIGSTLRDALLEAGATPAKADKAAEELAAYENRLAGIESDLNVLKWMTGTNIALTLAIFGAVLKLLAT